MFTLSCLLLLAADPKPMFWGVVHANFAQWDQNRDGELTLTELDTCIADAQLRGHGASAAVALRRATRAKTEPLTLPITQAKLDEIRANTTLVKQWRLESSYASGVYRLNNPSRDLFANGATPTLDTIHQGRIGNCFCLAPFGAMLHRDPQAVQRLIEPLPNGNFRVEFPSCMVVVAPLTDGELLLTGSTEKNGTWLNVYEKAVGVARNAMRPTQYQSPSALEAIARGGNVGSMIEFLTGNPSQRFRLKFPRDEKFDTPEVQARLAALRTGLESAQAERRIIACGTDMTASEIPGMVPTHAYAVLGYDRATDTITLWNPHGSDYKPKGTPGLKFGYRQKDGRIEMPLKEFAQIFSSVNWELFTRPQPARS